MYEVTFPLPVGEADAALGTYRDAVAERERSADVASLRHLLAPASVAVIGASRRPGSVGRAILRNIITSGFRGAVYVVNPGGAELDGFRACLVGGRAARAGRPAVIAAPAPAVCGIAEQCGRRGVKALAVITSGLGGRRRGGRAGRYHGAGRARRLPGLPGTRREPTRASTRSWR